MLKLFKELACNKWCARAEGVILFASLSPVFDLLTLPTVITRHRSNNIIYGRNVSFFNVAGSLSLSKP